MRRAAIARWRATCSAFSLLSVFSSAAETGLGVGVWGKWEALVRLYFAGAEDSAVAWVRENLL